MADDRKLSNPATVRVSKSGTAHEISNTNTYLLCFSIIVGSNKLFLFNSPIFFSTLII